MKRITALIVFLMVASVTNVFADEMEPVSGIGDLLSAKETLKKTVKESVQPKKLSSGGVSCNGDKVVFHRDKNMTEATGNVVVGLGDTTIYADRVEYYMADKKAFASGNVMIVRGGEIFFGDEITYDSVKKEGIIHKAQAYAAPWYIKGDEVERKSADEFYVKNASMTTCDYDCSHYTINASSVSVYPGKKLYAYNMTFNVKDIPLLWFPWYSYPLDNKRSTVAFKPGYSSRFGAFLKTEIPVEHFKSSNWFGTAHADYYKKRGFAYGFDADFNNLDDLEWKLVSYTIDDDDYVPYRGSVEDTNRYRLSLDADYQMTADTRALLKFNMISDLDFMDDFFNKEYEEDTQLDNYLNISKTTTDYQLNMMATAKVNSIYSILERQPEITFNLNSQQLGDSNFYFSNRSAFVNYNYEPLGADGYHTSIFDVVNNLSYSRKFFRWLTFQPFFEIRNQYHTKGRTEDSLWNETFATGASVKTRIYKVFETYSEKYNIDKLRHVIEPTVSYRYVDKPSTESSEVYAYGLNEENAFVFSLRNKLQTKRMTDYGASLGEEAMAETVDLVDLNVSLAYYIEEKQKQANGNHRYSEVLFDLELTPCEYIDTRLYVNYNLYDDKISSAYLDVLLYEQEDFSVSLGHRFVRDSNNLFALEAQWQVNPEWFVKGYWRFESETGDMEDQEYSIIKNLHCFNMALSFRDRAYRDEQIYSIVFYLKDVADTAKLNAKF